MEVLVVKSLPYDLILPFGVGVFLLVVAGVQYHFGKVYTRGGRGIKWHSKTFVTKEETPIIFGPSPRIMILSYPRQTYHATDWNTFH